MATSENQGAGNSNGGTNCKIWHQKSTSYMHYVNEQIVVFEAIYAQCPHPSTSQRFEMKRMFPVLSNIDDKEIKAWFENRRGSENLKKENYDLHSIKEKLTTTNKLLKDENDNLMKKVTELLSENDFLKQKLHDAS